MPRMLANVDNLENDASRLTLTQARFLTVAYLATIYVVFDFTWQRTVPVVFDTLRSLCTAPGSLDTHLCYAAWHSSYSSRASIGV